MKKIIYCKKSDGNVVKTKTVEFDTVTGSGLSKLIYGYNNLLKQEAFDQLGFLIPLIPILHKVPSPTILTTLWLKYPEVIPTPRAMPYRCHCLIEGSEVITWLPESVPEAWEQMGVYEFTESLQNNRERTVNPAHGAIKADYDMKFNQWAELFRTTFKLYQTYVQPVFPTGYEYFENGIKINNFNPQDYYCPPTEVTNETKITQTIQNTCLLEPVLRIKSILGI